MAHSHEGHASCGPGYASPREAMEKAEHEKVLYTMVGALRRDRHRRAGLSGHGGLDSESSTYSHSDSDKRNWPTPRGRAGGDARCTRG